MISSCAIGRSIQHQLPVAVLDRIISDIFYLFSVNLPQPSTAVSSGVGNGCFPRAVIYCA